MEVAAAAPAFDALAFAFAAFAFALVAGALVINPLRGAAVAAATLPVIGGAVSWVLSRMADLVQASVYAVEQSKNAAYYQAASWWNWIVTTTIWHYYGDINGNVAWLIARVSDLWAQSFGAIPQQISAAFAWIQYLRTSVDNLAAWQTYVATQTIPAINAWIDYLNRYASTLAANVAAIDTQALPSIYAWITYLQTQAAAASSAIAYIDGVALPRLEADIGRRALEAEAEAIRLRLGELQRALGILWPLALIAVAGAEAIDNLRCQMDVPCDPLSQLAGSDVLDRLNHLEISEG